ncbi:MAG TPA: hypothetical protein VLT90_06890 [Terriglobales bacterium]|nr:hypothetical protein [Terriglobales bacterium]
MTRRIRHCVECPKCHTRYLIGASPYTNGAYLVMPPSDLNTHTLYCPCGKSAFTSRWSESKTYIVSNPAYDRGYGSPEEIIPAEPEKKSRVPLSGADSRPMN